MSKFLLLQSYSQTSELLTNNADIRLLQRKLEYMGKITLVVIKLEIWSKNQKDKVFWDKVDAEDKTLIEYSVDTFQILFFFSWQQPLLKSV